MSRLSRAAADPDALPFVVASAAGAAVWISVGLLGGRSEAWASESYWEVGYPALVLVVALLAARYPRRPWRWAAAACASQAMVALAIDPAGVLPLGWTRFLLLPLPLILTAWLVTQVVRLFRPASRAVEAAAQSEAVLPSPSTTSS